MSGLLHLSHQTKENIQSLGKDMFFVVIPDRVFMGFGVLVEEHAPGAPSTTASIERFEFLFLLLIVTHYSIVSTLESRRLAIGVSFCLLSLTLLLLTVSNFTRATDIFYVGTPYLFMASYFAINSIPRPSGAHANSAASRLNLNTNIDDIVLLQLNVAELRWKRRRLHLLFIILILYVIVPCFLVSLPYAWENDLIYYDSASKSIEIRHDIGEQVEVDDAPSTLLEAQKFAGTTLLAACTVYGVGLLITWIAMARDINKQVTLALKKVADYHASVV